ncbi:MAG TPA: hypothetical protein VNV40_02710 [Steroidobacteraceae bacterium]|nr:hypothetical protein [Steroidobacteraceae bacterium]
MRRAAAPVLLLIVAVAAVVLLLRPARPGHGPASTPEAPPHREMVTGARPASAPSPARANPPVAAAPGMTTAAFNQRLRCVDVRRAFERLAPTDVLALLCQRKPLAALAIETPLAEAGDMHAITVVAEMANNGNCKGPPTTSFASFHAHAIERAKTNGASAETVRRLEGWLSEEEQGLAPEELAACRQAKDEMDKLRPELMNQIAGVLGRPLDPAKDTGPDSEIEYRRKTLAAGNAEDAEQLAHALLDKGTPASQAEAMGLLREAARTSASAKTQLARCLLTGCPSPAADPDEAAQLLTAAAAEGDFAALHTLAGEPGASELPGNDALPPAPERYAWSQLLQKLNEEGCFGAGFFAAWAASPAASQSLRAMSPADAEAAQNRARQLLAAQLERTRARLGCN